MKQRPRIYYTEAQKALMWDRWKAGDTLHEIGKLFDRPHTSIHTILSATGGIRPPARRRSRWALTMSEREEISRALAAGEMELIHICGCRVNPNQLSCTSSNWLNTYCSWSSEGYMESGGDSGRGMRDRLRCSIQFR